MSELVVKKQSSILKALDESVNISLDKSSLTSNLLTASILALGWGAVSTLLAHDTKEEEPLVNDASAETHIKVYDSGITMKNNFTITDRGQSIAVIADSGHKLAITLPIKRTDEFIWVYEDNEYDISELYVGDELSDHDVLLDIIADWLRANEWTIYSDKQVAFNPDTIAEAVMELLYAYDDIPVEYEPATNTSFPFIYPDPMSYYFEDALKQAPINKTTTSTGAPKPANKS